MSSPGRDLALDSSGDLAIVDGDLVLTSSSSAIAQLLRQNLGTFHGELFWDEGIGVRWFDILGQKDASAILESEVRRVALATPGVTAIESLASTLDPAARTASLALVVTSSEGAIAVNLTVP